MQADITLIFRSFIQECSVRILASPLANVTEFICCFQSLQTHSDILLGLDHRVLQVSLEAFAATKFKVKVGIESVPETLENNLQIRGSQFLKVGETT